MGALGDGFWWPVLVTSEKYGTWMTIDRPHAMTGHLFSGVSVGFTGFDGISFDFNAIFARHWGYVTTSLTQRSQDMQQKCQSLIKSTRRKCAEEIWLFFLGEFRPTLVSNMFLTWNDYPDYPGCWEWVLSMIPCASSPIEPSSAPGSDHCESVAGPWSWVSSHSHVRIHGSIETLMILPTLVMSK